MDWMVATGPVMVAAACFGINPTWWGKSFWRPIFSFPMFLNRARLPLFAVALIGAGLGFLWYNAPPAAVFMGDTGSWALGGTLAPCAYHQTEIVLAIVGVYCFREPYL